MAQPLGIFNEDFLRILSSWALVDVNLFLGDINLHQRDHAVIAYLMIAQGFNLFSLSPRSLATQTPSQI